MRGSNHIVLDQVFDFALLTLRLDLSFLLFVPLHLFIFHFSVEFLFDVSHFFIQLSFVHWIIERKILVEHLVHVILLLLHIHHFVLQVLYFIHIYVFHLELLGFKSLLHVPSLIRAE